MNRTENIFGILCHTKCKFLDDLSNFSEVDLAASPLRVTSSSVFLACGLGAVVGCARVGTVYLAVLTGVEASAARARSRINEAGSA